MVVTMEKYVIIDSRMRRIEKDFFKSLGYKIIEIKKSEKVYPEISSHVDIFVSQIDDILICEKSQYEYLKNSIPTAKIICGEDEVQCKYPNDVKYNVCQIGNNVVHNFKYTDKKISQIIDEKNLKKIQISQGYTNCSIAVIDEKSTITSDKKIAQELENNNIDCLYFQNSYKIKLLDENANYSKMNGFIGGAIGKIDNKIIVFGDLSKIDTDNEIRMFVESKNLELIDFNGLDVIDYGGIITIN